MRKFYFQNSIGERFDLNDTSHVFLTVPAGLGLSYSVNQAKLGNGFYKETHIDYPAEQFMADINCRGYAAYRDLVDYLNSGRDLSLVYDPDGTEYYADIHIQNLSKGELEQGRLLVCTMVVLPSTPWYRPAAQVINIEPEVSGASSIWPLKWNYRWAAEATAGEIPVKAQGHLPSAIKVEAQGPLYDPCIELVKGDEIIGKMQLDASVPAGSTLVFSTIATDSGVWIDGTDQIEHIDLANDNFFRVPVGDDGYKLRITTEQQVSITARVSIYDYYRSV